MKKEFAMFLATLLVATVASSQPKSLISNDSLRYRVFTTPMKLSDSNKIEPEQTFIQILARQSSRKKVRALKYSDWMSLLTDPAKDWAANLWLYDIHQKDASIFKTIRDRASWLRCCKAEDIDYWKKHLNH